MKASEARELTEHAYNSSANKYLQHVYETVKRQANEGVAQVQMSSPESHIISTVMDHLRHNGYKVERSNGYDQRDGESWDYLIISWST